MSPCRSYVTSEELVGRFRRGRGGFKQDFRQAEITGRRTALLCPAALIIFAVDKSFLCDGMFAVKMERC